MTKPTLEHVIDFSIRRNEDLSSKNKCFLIILNYKLPLFSSVLWDQSCLRICADGGANRLYDEFPLMFPGESPSSVRLRYIPDIIKGDLDSLKPEVEEFYKNRVKKYVAKKENEDNGTVIINVSEDQDSTDLEKCLIIADEKITQSQNFKIVVLGGLGGRIDHELANFNALYKFEHLRIYLLSNHSLIFVLPSSYHHVIYPSEWEGPHCGLIPLGQPSNSTFTTGLMWNLKGQSMAFGSLVSSCNRLVESKVEVDSDVTLLWTTEINCTD